VAPAQPAIPAPAPATPAASSNTTITSTAPATGPASQPADKSPPSFLGGLGNFLPIILMFVVLYFILFRGQRKEEKKRKEMISEMKKGDRVQTIGGLVGRIVSIDNDEVVLKVDESANVKMTFKKFAIHSVLTEGDEKTK
jgi:preprotein translocase subunit YajC